MNTYYVPVHVNKSCISLFTERLKCHFEFQCKWRIIFFFCPNILFVSEREKYDAQCHRPYLSYTSKSMAQIYLLFWKQPKEFVYSINKRIQIDIIQPTSGTILYPADLPFLVFPDFTDAVNETDASGFADLPEGKANHFIKVFYTVYSSYTYRNA